MKLVEFKYTKSDGSVSNRAVLELQAPNNYFEGIDVSQMPEEVFAEFSQLFSDMRRKHHEQTMQLLSDWDLKHNYRRFLPDKMADVSVDYV
jgi:hypothetical protein